jgi:ribosome-associated protein
VDVEVRRDLVIPDSELSVRFAPSGGPGGQHANRSNTRVELSWRVEDSSVLSDGDRQLLLKILGPVVRIVVDDERSQLRNRDLAERRLGDRVAAALVRPKRRRPTKPSRSAKRRRVEGKRQRGELKQQRRRPRRDD